MPTRPALSTTDVSPDFEQSSEISGAPERITGFKNANEAAEKLGKFRDEVYKPNPDNVAVYDKLYQEYKTLHKYFGTGENDVMKRLNKIREDRLSE